MELDEKFNLLRTLTQKIRSYDKHLIDTVTFVENPDGTKTATITYSHQAEFSGEIVYIDLLAKTNDLLDFLFYKPLNLSLLLYW